MVDLISGGRLEFGIGAGWYGDEYKAYGYDFPPLKTRLSQLEEATRIITMMWTEEFTTFQGQHFSILNAPNNPKPIQKPRPRVWIGGKSNKILKMTARMADGWNVFHHTPEEFEATASKLKRFCKDVNRQFDEITLSYHCPIVLAKNEYELNQKLRRFEDKSAFKDIPNTKFEEFLKYWIVGTPERCISKIDKYIDAGVQSFILVFPDITDPSALRLFAEEIMPSFTKKSQQ